jgi:hypothetical protein
VTELSFPCFLYEKYTANVDNLEAGLFKGQILVQVRDTKSPGYDLTMCCQGYKAVFTSPSSAKDIEGDGDGADVIFNNRRARRAGWGLKVKKHVAQIIKMEKVTPRSIAYIACQVSCHHYHDIVYFLILYDRYDLHFLQSRLGGPLMVISTMYTSGGPSWTFSNDPPVEKRGVGLINSLSGGIGTYVTLILSTSLD